jgi:hypothetical protein
MFALAPDVIITEDETGAVLLDQRTGRYWLTNDTGAVVLRHLGGSGTVEEAVDELCAGYAHADPVRVEWDTRSLLDQLQRAGLVRT